MELAEVFAHARRFELESPHRLSLLIKTVSELIVDGDVVEINIDAP